MIVFSTVPVVWGCIKTNVDVCVTLVVLNSCRAGGGDVKGSVHFGGSSKIVVGSCPVWGCTSVVSAITAFVV